MAVANIGTVYPRSVGFLVLATGLLLAGCSGSEDSVDGAASSRLPEVGTPPQVTRSADLKYPMQSYTLTDGEVRTLSNAQEVLTQQCMRRFGFTYEISDTPSTDNESGTARRYGLSEAANAERYGYANPEVPPTDRNDDRELEPAMLVVLNGPDDIDPNSLPETQEEAEAGGKKGDTVPVGGCSRESYLKLYAPTKGMIDVSFAQTLERDAYMKSRTDPRVTEIIKKWQACMGDGGYSVNDPVSPLEDLGVADDPSGDVATKAAVLDVQCKEKLNLVGVWFSVESAYQKLAVDENVETLTKYQEQSRDRLRYANSLISGQSAE
ncbi:hypothetical protein L1I79_33320 [Strepomyces sp. STD 3.1]|uniref:hypothetical protein n=1 Tax=Streptomyces sp. NPDC058985 TaxID=3346684 RepID=UPI001F1A3608|nr:hypothetical protein [Streptomyces sp. STD 3.1]